MEFDVAIVGGGLAGASLARLLKESGLGVALVENAGPPKAAASKNWDNRVYALSPASVAFLEEIGAWGALDLSRVTPVYEMQIFGDDGASRLEFSAYDAGVSELCVIVENRRLQAALWDVLSRQEGLEIICPAECISLDIREERAQLRLDDARTVETRLLVGADGADSWVRAQAGIEARVKSYGQTALVANFRCEKSHHNIARQWFRNDGVLAFLPLGPNLVSIVWSIWDGRAKALLALEPAEFQREVMKAGRESLGAMELAGRTAAFPLRGIQVAHVVQPRLALVGDAAHNVHPLAGQGINLGFADAKALGRTLVERGPQRDCGDYILLRRYERARKEPVLAMQWTTDWLQALFNNDSRVLGKLRNTGLGATNARGKIKKLLMQHALG